MNTWKFVSHYEGAHTCENCGHDIKQCFVIESDAGAQMVVGSDCVESFLAPEHQPTFKTYERRRKRAESQWRKNIPEKREGETRSEYVARRISEMGNAKKAYKAWAEISNNRRLGKETVASIALRRLEERGETAPAQRYGDAWWAWSEKVRREENAILDEKISIPLNANRHDYMTSWYKVVDL